MCILIGVFGLLIYVAWSWWGLYPSLISFEGFFNPTKFSVYFGAMIQGLVVSAALHFLVSRFPDED